VCRQRSGAGEASLGRPSVDDNEQGALARCVAESGLRETRRVIENGSQDQSPMKSAPRSPSELRDALAAIFPALPRDFGVSGESVLEEAGPTYHSVMRDFAYFFVKDLDRFPDRQLGRLAKLVVRALATPGPLENAMQTCFLEHTRQVKLARRFEPFLLSAAEKEARK
jgi:hypothetical protein